MADYGLVVFASNGTKQVFSPSYRFNNIIASGVASATANGSSAWITCPGANDTANVVIIITNEGGLTLVGSITKEANRFRINDDTGAGITVNYIAIRHG